MFLLAGLGNPGRDYALTRHNAGFMAVDYLAMQTNATWKAKAKFSSQICDIKIQNHNLLLCKPETYMNLSGTAISIVASFYKISSEKIIIFHDDLDLALGKIGYKLGGGHGGHNGLKSIDKYIGQNYHRIRIGIGRPQNSGQEITDFVLQNFSSEEGKIITKVMQLIQNNIELLILGQVDKFKQQISQKIIG